VLRPSALHRPTSLDEVADLLEAHGSEAALYAGGTELLLLMKEGLLRPDHLIDVKRVPDLSGLAGCAGGEIAIGAAVPHRAVETAGLLHERAPLLARVARHVANARVRSVGTVGGNLAFADPHSDLATVLLTLDATVLLWSRRGTRALALADFIRGPYETARDDDEVLTAVRLRPWPAGTAAAYAKFGIYERPTLGVAVALVPAGDETAEARGGSSPAPRVRRQAGAQDEGTAEARAGSRHGAGEARAGARHGAGEARAVRLAIGCVGPRPERLVDVERQAGLEPPARLLARADDLAAAAAEAVEPVDDRHGSAEYKRELTRVFVRRALRAAVARAEGGEPHVRHAHTILV
jgi:carbon-monoxide dehydrogenase medium subunit